MDDPANRRIAELYAYANDYANGGDKWRKIDAATGALDRGANMREFKKRVATSYHDSEGLRIDKWAFPCPKPTAAQLDEIAKKIDNVYDIYMEDEHVETVEHLTTRQDMQMIYSLLFTIDRDKYGDILSNKARQCEIAETFMRRGKI